MSRSKSSVIITTIHVPSTVLHASHTLSHLTYSSSLLDEMVFIPILQIRKSRLWGLNVKTCNNWASVWTQSQSLSPEPVNTSGLCSQVPAVIACLLRLASPQTGHPARRLTAERKKKYYSFPRRPAVASSQQVNYGCQQERRAQWIYATARPADSRGVNRWAPGKTIRTVMAGDVFWSWSTQCEQLWDCRNPGKRGESFIWAPPVPCCPPLCPIHPSNLGFYFVSSKKLSLTPVALFCLYKPLY